MGARIFFAWVERHETEFTAAHHRIDEEVFALHRSLDEGEFPSLEVDVWNEGVGFLAPGRRQWVWVSYEREAGDVMPLFFGRIVGVPQQFSEDMVRLTFRARPQDYEDRKEQIAAQHRNLPIFDPLWMSEAERRDPDAILEAQSKLWWVDPVSHEVELSDIVTGEAGTLVFTADMVDDDTLQMSYSRPPARRVNVEAAVRWTQAGRDEIDLTPALQAAFGTVTPAHSVSIDGEEFPTAGLVCLAAGEEMMRAWPDTGTAIGGGWSIGTSIIGRIDRQPSFQIVSSEATWSRVLDNSISGHQASKINFGSGGALVGPVQQGAGNLPAGPFDPPPEIVWVPIWTMFAQLGAVWEASRNREETIRFTMEADVQPVLVDDEAHDSDHIDLSFGPAAVDAPLGEDPGATEPTAATASEPHVTAGPIGDLRRRSYFKTTRGRMSFEHVLLRARAALLDRARCVDVVFETGFEDALEVTTRHSVTLLDDGEGSRIPGGQVTGKVVHASLTVDGRTGAFSARIMLGCTAGRSGEVIVEPVIGAPTYAEEGYGETGYEVHAGAIHVPPAGDIGYEDYTDQPIDDDGIDLTRIARQDYLAGIAVEGGLVKEMEQVDTPDAIAPGGWLHQPWNPAHSPYQLVERIRAVDTTIRLEMVPVTGGPFHTVIEPEVGMLKVPRLVDLEAAAATG